MMIIVVARGSSIKQNNTKNTYIHMFWIFEDDCDDGEDNDDRNSFKTAMQT